jgi:hypothetical protein
VQPQARKLVAKAIKEARPKAQVYWTGEAQIVCLHVSEPGQDERYFTIDSAYVDTADRVGDLIADVLDFLG